MCCITRFCSDPHFYHLNMAIHRGFKDDHEMNEHIINEWNKIIKPKDITYILGDITMEKNKYEILYRLNGNKKIILGNHDKPQHTKYLYAYVNSISGMQKISYTTADLKKYKVWLTHCPMHESELIGNEINIHGHVHDKSLQDKRYINVSMEAINYQPKTLNELINII